MNRMPCLWQISSSTAKKIPRRNDESAFAEHRLGNHGGNILGSDNALEGVFQMWAQNSSHDGYFNEYEQR